MSELGRFRPIHFLGVTLVGLVHFIVSFFAWAACDAPRAAESACRPWSVLSFPVIPLLGRGIATEWFYSSLAINSVGWGVASVALIGSIAMQLRNGHGASRRDGE
jgi:hypothetical protein